VTLPHNVQTQAADRVDALIGGGLLNTTPTANRDQIMKLAVELTQRVQDPGDPREWLNFELLLIAIAAPHRLWWDDLEQDYPPDYVAALTDWGQITQGFFVPTSINQTWSGEDGDPIILEFDWDHRHHRFEVPVDSDWLDLTLIFRLNDLFPPEAPRFYHVEQEDQTAQVLFLSPDEAAFLKERGWILFSTAHEVPKRESVDWDEFFRS
jgi:hypothetical protein